MFEKYTKKTRRAIFWARHEAGELGSASIESEHMLLGLFRADLTLARRVGLPEDAEESIRREIEAQKSVGKSVASAVKLPLSLESKLSLAIAAEEAVRLDSQHIETEHIFLGLLRQEKCFAGRILLGLGFGLEAIRRRLSTSAGGSDVDN